MLMITFLSHFLPIQLSKCYLDPSFLLFLLPLDSLTNGLLIPSPTSLDLNLVLGNHSDITTVYRVT